MTLELSMYFLSGVLFVVCCLIGVIWNQKNAEIKEHSRILDLKVNTDRLADLESRMAKDMQSADERWERMFDKQDAKNIRDAESIRNDFREQLVQIREQVRTSEINILAQMNLLFKSNHKND